MERRGDGVAIILKETQEITGVLPKYKLVNESSLILTIPAAKLELTPAVSTVTVHSDGEPLSQVQVLVLFPNKTWQQASTDELGEANFDLYTTDLPMTVYAATKGYSAGIAREWNPQSGGLLLELKPLRSGGAVIFPQSTGHIPGLQGRLNPILDTSDRTYMYADNIAIDEGKQQPVSFRLGNALKLTDAYGMEMNVTVIDIMGNSSLLEYETDQTN